MEFVEEQLIAFLPLILLTIKEKMPTVKIFVFQKSEKISTMTK